MEVKRGKRIFHDDFQTGWIDEQKWLPAYLPHWTTPELARPRHHFEDGNLVLCLDKDQPAWCPAHDGEVKCSSIQTGHFSGALGEHRGQLRFSPNVRVVTELAPITLFAPLYGHLEIRCKADIASNNMVAFWTTGLEHAPEDSGEITVMEIFGRNCGPSDTKFGHGVKQGQDPRLTTEYHEDLLPFSVADWHIYGVTWAPDGTTHYLDGKKICQIKRAPHHQQQLMLGIYELPHEPQPSTKRTATFTIDYVECFELA